VVQKGTPNNSLMIADAVISLEYDYFAAMPIFMPF